MNKKIIIMGGGTFSHVRSHLALAAPAFGTTAKALNQLCFSKFTNMDVKLYLTKMADPSSKIVTNEDVELVINTIVNDNTVKIVFFNVALCDYNGAITEEDIGSTTPSGKYETRLETSDGPQYMELTPAKKIIRMIRKKRKDIFLVGFKTTCGADGETMFNKGLNLLKKASCNLVLVNDVKTRANMIVTPEDGVYGAEMSRDEALAELVDIAWHRTHLSFTRSTVVDGKPVSWDSPEIYPAIREVVNYCISRNAYKPFNGATTGHFAVKLKSNEFLTSIRKTDFNKISKVGMVKVTTDGEDDVISYGAKPSVGGQSQRKIFSQYQDVDCIVHFHSPLKKGHPDDIPVVSQREYECGSHECGENTARGLGKIGNLYCVMLDKHGPNIVFNHNIDPKEVIDFIDRNFALEQTTSGFAKVNLELV